MINYRTALLIALLVGLCPVVSAHALEQNNAVSAPVYTPIKGTACAMEMSVPSFLGSHIVITPVVLPPVADQGEKTITPTLISPVCQFDVDDDRLYDPKLPLTLSMKYTDDKGYRPRIYFWEGKKNQWVPLPTTMNRVTKIVTADIHLAYAKIAVLIEENGNYEGVASWYADKRYPDGAATDRYPVGTRLKITNLSNNKTTLVVTTSTWNNPNKNRIVDLVKTAFSKIADPNMGLARVRIEKLF